MQDQMIARELSHHEHLRRQLQREFPDADEETLNDTLEGMTNLPEMLAAVLRSQLEDLALAKGLRSYIAELQKRLGRLEGRAQRKRQLACLVMQRAELRRLVEPDFSASLRRTAPALCVLDEGEIPPEFWKPQPPKLDRTAVTGALRAGVLVPGAMLDNGGTTLVLRTK